MICLASQSLGHETNFLTIAFIWSISCILQICQFLSLKTKLNKTKQTNKETHKNWVSLFLCKLIMSQVRIPLFWPCQGFISPSGLTDITSQPPCYQGLFSHWGTVDWKAGTPEQPIPCPGVPCAFWFRRHLCFRQASLCCLLMPYKSVSESKPM